MKKINRGIKQYKQKIKSKNAIQRGQSTSKIFNNIHKFKSSKLSPQYNLFISKNNFCVLSSQKFNGIQNNIFKSSNSRTSFSKLNINPTCFKKSLLTSKIFTKKIVQLNSRFISKPNLNISKLNPISKINELKSNQRISFLSQNMYKNSKLSINNFASKKIISSSITITSKTIFSHITSPFCFFPFLLFLFLPQAQAETDDEEDEYDNQYQFNNELYQYNNYTYNEKKQEEKKGIMQRAMDEYEEDDLDHLPLDYQTEEKFNISKEEYPEIQNPLRMDVRISIDQLAEYLELGKISPNLQDQYGWTWMHEAALFTRDEHTELLLDWGGNPNIQDETGLTPLHVAAGSGNFYILGLLLDRGGDPNLRDINGTTPLMKAVQSGNPLMVSSLMIAGGSPYLQDYRGMNSFDLAKETHGQMLTILSKRS